MNIPDLTPEQAEQLRQARPSLLYALAWASVLFALVIWLATFVEHRSHIPARATGIVSIGIIYGALALAKPTLYWSGESALQARLRRSASSITTTSLIFAVVIIGLGILDLFF